MKKIIQAEDINRITDEILHNCLMLGFADDESAEDDLSFYVPRIKRAAEDLKGIVKASKPAPEDQGGGS